MSRIRVSDHALLRLLHLFGGLDVDRFRDSIAGSLERACDAAAQINENEYTIASNGFRYIVRNGVLVTVETQTIRRREMSTEDMGAR